MTLEIFSTLILGGLTVLALCLLNRKSVVVWDHEAGLHFKHGKLLGILSPGRHVFWGWGHEFQMSEKRLQMLPIQTQEIHTADTIAVKVSAMVIYQVSDHEVAYRTATDGAASLYAAVQLAMRDAVASVDLDKLMGIRGSLSEGIIGQVNLAAEQLGLKVSDAAIRDVILPADIKSAQHEALRAKKEAVAKLEVARGEAAAMRTLANAAKQLENRPEVLKLKYLEVLEKAAQNGCNTFIVGGHEDTTKAIKVN